LHNKCAQSKVHGWIHVSEIYHMGLTPYIWCCVQVVHQLLLISGDTRHGDATHSGVAELAYGTTFQLGCPSLTHYTNTLVLSDICLLQVESMYSVLKHFQNYMYIYLCLGNVLKGMC
jgi:hypothetical protein